jgi:transposase
MARSLNIRTPRLAEFRKLDQLLCAELHPRQHRRAQAVLLHGQGLSGVDIAAALGVHPLTIYADLRAFAAAGLGCLQPPRRGGPAKLLDPEQEARICHLAEASPIDLGLPFSRWTLRRLRAYLIKERVVGRISREHLRRVLRKGGCATPASSARSLAATRSG